MQAIDASNLFQDIKENFEKYANSNIFEEQFLAMRFKQIEQYIKTFPVVEVVPVKRGKWLETSHKDKKRCSVCDRICFIAIYPWFFGMAHYCPSCGAEMEDGVNE